MMKSSFIIYLAICLTLCIVGITESKLIKGDFYVSNSTWDYIDKFAFTQDSYITFNIVFPMSSTSKVLLYSDKHWDDIIDHTYSCHQLQSMAEAQVDATSPFNNGMQIPIKQQRSRYWYIVFSDCEFHSHQKNRIHLHQYSIDLVNNGDTMNHKISADEFFIPHISILNVIILVGVLLMSICTVGIQSRFGYQSDIIKMFSTSVVLKLVSLIILLGYYGVYYSKETNYDNLKLASTCVDIFSRTIFILVLLLFSQGFSVSTVSASMAPKLMIPVSLLLYLTYSLVSSIFYSAFTYSYRVPHYYIDSPIGFPLLGIILAIFLYFCFSIFQTRSEQMDETRRKLLLVIGSIFSLWFLMYPISVIISHFTDDWIRFKYVVGFNQLSETLFYMIFSIIFIACKSNKFIHVFNPITSTTSTNDKLKIINV